MRNWRSVAVGSAWLLAAACGGNEGGETARADLETESMGGESAATAQTGDEFAPGDSYGAAVYSDDQYATDTQGYGTTGADDLGAGGSVGIGGGGIGAEGSAGLGEDTTQGSIGTGTTTQGTFEDDQLAQGTTQQDPFAQGTQQQPEGTMPEGTMSEGMQQQDAFGQQAGAQAQVCPADIEGLNVRVSTIPRGGALVFTVGREDVQVLRDRLDRFAQLHRQHREAMQSGEGMQGMHGEGSMGSAQGTPSGGASGSVGAGGAGASGSIGAGGAGVGAGAGAGMAQSEQQQQFADQEALIHQASEVRVVEIPRGARLEFRFDDSERVSDLRSALRENATMLRDGRCPLALQLES